MTPDSLHAFGSSVMVKGGGRMLGVGWMTESVSESTLTFQYSISLVVIGGMVIVVVSVVELQLVDVDFLPSESVTTVDRGHATSRDVVMGAILIVVGVFNPSGGSIIRHGGSQYASG